ncbi:TIGR04104 family putative zinc finger protein [Bacillus sp. CHD6a]|uniref:TIGR04104 family putative zinc finger protein n=1 Tax=Bacillus sp. CHD6a TaxID=1643452 RepID=UPI0006CCC0C5|nr:TIGR04104 family putative zinc finger protein [Bacillus sp. CHD6a]KPB03981.1 hypothetical protein AAV98_14135 [Bacillus sp. CHD6a]
MSFHQCPNCQEEIKYKTKLTSVFFGYRPIKCKSCGTVYEVDEKFRFILSLYTVLIPILIAYMLSAMMGVLHTRWSQVLIVLVFGSAGVFYAATKVRYRKSLQQPMKEKEEKKAK